jgi:hypothetical protein
MTGSHRRVPLPSCAGSSLRQVLQGLSSPARMGVLLSLAHSLHLCGAGL